MQSWMSLRCSRGKCYFILAPRSVQSCALLYWLLYSSGYHCETALIGRGSLLEKKVNTLIFFFQRPAYVHNQLYKCRLLITFDYPTRCSCDNTYMCIQVIIWPRCASRSYWHWGSHIGLRALARGPIWLYSANMT